jgi:aminoglycoside phosphotransferase (APT) family kinase protein
MSRPGWAKMDIAMKSALDEVLSRLPQTHLPLVADPEKSDAFGINSSNFRLKTTKGVFVLKRWSDQAIPRDVHNTLGIMAWLASRQLPVPAPVEIQQDSFTLSIGSGTWSLFPFVEGDYFSGADDELCAAAEATGRLMETLTLLPATRLPSEGPAQMTAADGELLRRVKHVSKNWDLLLGTEHAEVLALSWPVLMAEWEALSAKNIVSGRIQAAHFDLHPHNLLINEGKVVALLDFEACKVMPLGFALGFAALKQCRQAMTLRPQMSDPRLVGSLYLDHLLLTLPCAHQFATHLGDLAVAEVLRRICIILRLNLEKGERKWNKVLGTQLGHLGEARALFG